MIPRPSVTGSISLNTRRMRGSRQSNASCRRKAHSPEHRQRHRELHDGSDQHSDRVGVELGVAVEQRLSPISSTMITTFHTSGAMAGIVKWS